MMKERYLELKAAEKGAVISIVTYLVLAAAKIAVSNLADSSALRADGLNNTTDIMASVAVLAGLRLARRPADDDHPYGHWKAETVASMVTSFIMLAVGIEVMYSGTQRFFDGMSISPDPLAAYTGLASGLVLLCVYYYNTRLAKKLNSSALKAAARDTLNDALISFSTALVIFGSGFFDIAWLDSIMAIAVGIIILKTAIEIFRESAFALSDGFDEAEISRYKETMLTLNEVLEVEAIQARHYGSMIYVDAIIWTHPDMTVKRSHEVTELIEKMLHDQYGVYETKIHVEPTDIHQPAPDK